MKTEDEVEVIEKEEVALKEPDKYAVTFQNDDYTTMTFVLDILETEFGYNTWDAANKMMEVHEQGSAVVGEYSYDIATTKATRTMEEANKQGFPLVVTVNPVEKKP